MAEDGGKFPIRRMILQEIEKFSDPSKGQRLALIVKALAISKQNLNRYLKQFQRAGIVQRVQEQPYAIYQLTAKGRAVNDFLVQSQKGDKITMWRYHNLIMGYRIRKWGSWKFNSQALVRMNNWNYQIAAAENGLQAHVQDTALLKIYGPEVYGPDGEEARITSATKVSEAARWFIDKFDLELDEGKILRKGEKELQNSGQLAKLLGRVKTGDFFVNASGGTENLEEKEDSYMLESITEMPRRLDNVERAMDKLAGSLSGLAETVEKYEKQLSLHLEVEQRTLEATRAQVETSRETRTAISELRDAVRLISSDPYVPIYPRKEADAKTGDSEPREPAPGTIAAFTRRNDVQIQFTRPVGEFTYQDGGEVHYVPKQSAGKTIELPEKVALKYVSYGCAEVVGSG